MTPIEKAEAVAKWLLQPTCSYCGRPAEGNYSIHRDGFGVGPEVALCDSCGAHPTPTLRAIWDRIAQPDGE